MVLQKPAKDYYELAEIAAEWGWELNDLYDYYEIGKLEICVLSNLTHNRNTLHRKKPRPLTRENVRELAVLSGRVHYLNDPIMLVITHEEKKRFEKAQEGGVDQEGFLALTKHCTDEGRAISLTEKFNADEEKTNRTHHGQILIGWKAIAEYLKVSVSTAKRYSRKSRWLQHGPTKKPTTTTGELDAWQLSPAQKKKKGGE